jgi:hypothetical protein
LERERIDKVLEDKKLKILPPPPPPLELAEGLPALPPLPGGEVMQIDEEAGMTEEEKEAKKRKKEELEEELMKAFSEVVSCKLKSHSEVSFCLRRCADQSATSRRVDSSVEAPPSLLPPKKYCDVTGLEVRLEHAQSPFPIRN